VLTVVKPDLPHLTADDLAQHAEQRMLADPALRDIARAQLASDFANAEAEERKVKIRRFYLERGK
jgi:hypothetical protein